MRGRRAGDHRGDVDEGGAGGGLTVLDLLTDPALLNVARAEFRDSSAGTIGGTKWAPPLLPRDVAAAAHDRSPEYVTTARGGVDDSGGAVAARATRGADLQSAIAVAPRSLCCALTRMTRNILALLPSLVRSTTKALRFGRARTTRLFKLRMSGHLPCRLLCSTLYQLSHRDSTARTLIPALC